MHLKFNVLVFCLLIVLSLSFCMAYAQENEEVEKGGLAVCKVVGGNEKVIGNFKIRENFVILNNFDRELEVDLEGALVTKAGERSLESTVEVQDVEASDFKIGRILKTTSSQTELLVKLEEGEKEIAIVSLNQDENQNTLISNIKLLLTKISDKVSGVTQVTFPRTVTIPLDSPDLTAIENAGEGTTFALQDAVENGAVTLKCTFRNIPFTLIGGQ